MRQRAWLLGLGLLVALCVGLPALASFPVGPGGAVTLPGRSEPLTGDGARTERRAIVPALDAPTDTPAATPSITPTPDVRDAYEPDDVVPKPIILGQAQTHTFSPVADVDQVTFLAKGGRLYHVYTSDLALGVDTFLSVTVGSSVYLNDDRQPGDHSSELVLQGANLDAPAIVRISNRGSYGADKSCRITAEEIIATPTATTAPTLPPPPTSTRTPTLSPTPDLLDAYEPDDVYPGEVILGQVQLHNFHPARDVDKVHFLAKTGRSYRVSTSGLAAGVDTHVSVTVGSDLYVNDDRQPLDLSSEVTFRRNGPDADALVIVANRGVYGPDKWYNLMVEEFVPTPTATPTATNTGTPTVTSTPTQTPTVTLTPTANPRDAYEPDDVIPQPIIFGEPQLHSFYPTSDVDQVQFLAKPGRRYRVSTGGLAAGVDTYLSITVGTTVHTNDDRAPGDYSSSVTFAMSDTTDVSAIVRIEARGLYGGDKLYTLTAEELLPTPTPTLTPSPTPTLSPTAVPWDHYEPDDATPHDILAGQAQRHNFCPGGDVDNVQFLAQARHSYRVTASPLAVGLSIVLTPVFAGTLFLPSPARVPSLLGDAVLNLEVGAQDVAIIIEMRNLGQFGVDKWYQILIEDLTPATPTPSATPLASATPTSGPSPTGTQPGTTTPTLAATPTGTLSATPTGTLSAAPTGTLAPADTPSPQKVWLPMALKRHVLGLTPTPTPTFTPDGGPYPLPTSATATATRAATPVGCSELVLNGGFETTGAWRLGLTPHQAGYTMAAQHSGARAMRLGIEPGDSNALSYSSAYQSLTIPANATAATLRFWWQRRTEEATSAQVLSPEAGGARPDLPEDDAALGDMQGAVATYYDVHEVLLLDAYSYVTVAVLQQSRANDAGWVYVTRDLRAYRGRNLILYFNAYNDGLGGRTWMYVDDVSIQTCR